MTKEINEMNSINGNCSETGKLKTNALGLRLLHVLLIALLALLIGWQRDCHQRGCRRIFAYVPEPLRRIAEASEGAQLLGISAGS